MNNKEKTLFFIKPESNNPFIDKATALEIISFLEDKLGDNFTRTIAKRTPELPREFYEDFYSHLKGKFEMLDEMLDEFAGKSIAVFIYEGLDIIQRVKVISGATKYQDNIGKQTIRELFGNENMGYRTVAHASDREGVKHDFDVLEKWSII